MNALARTNGSRVLATNTETNQIDSFAILDVHAGGVSDEAPRPEWLCTISAGELVTQNNKTFPRASRDGRIFLHDPEGRAPGLKERLEANGSKRLTIAFPWDDPATFIQQRFERRSATRLEAYGDQHRIRVLSERGHQVYEAGTREYADQVATCKVVVSVLFTCAAWTDKGPVVELLDGLGGFYRLRFTSRNSLRSIVNTLRQVGRFTQGRLAGIPFDLSLDYRDVADGTGAKRHVCVWVINMRPPVELRLTSRNFAEVMSGALAQGSALMLPAPSQETLELAALEAPSLDLDELEISDDDAALLARGGRCDAAYFEKLWFAAVNGSDLDSDEKRAEFVDFFSNGRTRSLKEFLAGATDAEAAALLNEVAEYVLDRKKVQGLGAVLPSAVETGTLTRNQFIDLAMERYGYDGKLAIAKALGLVTLNAWTAGGERTWNDALAELDRIELAKALLDQPETLTPSGRPSVAEYEDGWVSEDDPGEDEPQAAVQDEPDEDDRAVGMADDEPPDADDEIDRELAEDDPQYLIDLWSTYHTQRGIAGRVGVKLGPIPSGENVTSDQLREAIADLGRKIERAQAQGSLV